jgi:type I restriction enzyme S subunit
MIDITPEQRATVEAILGGAAPECGAYAFGSRVTGGARPYSDLDMVLKGPVPLSVTRMGTLRERFQESSLPFRVNIVDWHALGEAFRRIVDEQGELLKPAA